MKPESAAMKIRSILFTLHYNCKFHNGLSYSKKVAKLTVERICKNCIVSPSCSKSFDCQEYSKKILPVIKGYLKVQNKKINKSRGI